jgi:cytochrome c oxidase subunit 3
MANQTQVAQGNYSATQPAPYHHGHHFESAHAEFEASKQGMWIFMVTEVLMIGAVFVGYFIFRAMYPEAFHEAHQLLNVKLGALNTVVLIISSVTMVLAVSATQRGNNLRAIKMLLATLTLGACFLVVKYFEYSHKIHEGILPAGFFTFPELTTPKAPLFYSFYFMMTGIPPTRRISPAKQRSYPCATLVSAPRCPPRSQGLLVPVVGWMPCSPR